MSKSKIVVGTVSEIKEKGERNLPLFMKEGPQTVKLMSTDTWGKSNQQCVVTDKGKVGAFQLYDRLEKDGLSEMFTEDGKFFFEPGVDLIITLKDKNIVQTELPADETPKVEGISEEAYDALSPAKQAAYKWNKDSKQYVLK